MPHSSTDRTLYVEMGDGAMMSLPLNDWLWQLRYQRPERDRGPTICDDRMIAAGVLESYLYLVEECNKEEAWRRIKLMREGLKEFRASQQLTAGDTDGR